MLKICLYVLENVKLAGYISKKNLISKTVIKGRK